MHEITTFTLDKQTDFFTTYDHYDIWICRSDVAAYNGNGYDTNSKYFADDFFVCSIYW